MNFLSHFFRPWDSQFEEPSWPMVGFCWLFWAAFTYVALYETVWCLMGPVRKLVRRKAETPVHNGDGDAD